jgi:KipI family sensor histidine kinase inhibitor
MWEALGDRAIRAPRPPGTSARALVQAARVLPGVVDVVVTADEIALYFTHEPVVDPALLDALAATTDDATTPREVTLHAIYDGPDLDDVARATGLTIADVIARHVAAVYTVDTLGFAPGFAYLTGLDAQLHLPRRSTPRTRVPAGSIAIAASYTAVYPFDSPGGWHLLGRVDGARMFGPDGALLHLGDRVRFTP